MFFLLLPSLYKRLKKFFVTFWFHVKALRLIEFASGGVFGQNDNVLERCRMPVGVVVTLFGALVTTSRAARVLAGVCSTVLIYVLVSCEETCLFVCKNTLRKFIVKRFDNQVQRRRDRACRY